MTTASSNRKDQELTTPHVHRHPKLAGTAADMPGQDGGEALAINHYKTCLEKEGWLGSTRKGTWARRTSGKETSHLKHQHTLTMEP